MTSFANWLAMGDYGVFIWPAYGLTTLLLVVFVVSSWRGLRARQRELQRLTDEQDAPSSAR